MLPRLVSPTKASKGERRIICVRYKSSKSDALYKAGFQP